MAELKRERKFRGHFIDASMEPGSGTPIFVRIGKDNDDLSRAITYNTEETQNVLGETENSTTRGGDTMDVNPYYIRKSEPLGMLLEAIDSEERQLDELKRDYVEVHDDAEAWEVGTSIKAFKQVVDIMPSTAGGPANNGDMIPFNLAFSGKKIPGTFNASTKTFTPTI